MYSFVNTSKFPQNSSKFNIIMSFFSQFFSQKSVDQSKTPVPATPELNANPSTVKDSSFSQSETHKSDDQNPVFSFFSQLFASKSVESGSQSETHESNHQSQTLETPNLELGSDQSTGNKVVEEGEDNEEEECGFCVFMKAGGCKESFVAWENCMDNAEKNNEDAVDKCSEVTIALTNCMVAHSEYYQPILWGQKAAEEQVMKQLEEEKKAEKEAEADKVVEPEVKKELEEEIEKSVDTSTGKDSDESKMAAEQEVKKELREQKDEKEIEKDVDPSNLSTGKDSESNKVIDEGGQDLEEEGEEDEEDEECGFCVYMKGGGCKESFVAWEDCIKDAEKNKEDMVDKCMDTIEALKKCMEAHSDYYGVMIRAEKEAEEEVKKEMEEEKKAMEGIEMAAKELEEEKKAEKETEKAVDTSHSSNQ